MGVVRLFMTVSLDGFAADRNGDLRQNADKEVACGEQRACGEERRQVPSAAPAGDQGVTAR